VLVGRQDERVTSHTWGSLGGEFFRPARVPLGMRRTACAVLVASLCFLPACTATHRRDAAPTISTADGRPPRRMLAGHVLETQVPLERWPRLPGSKVGLLVAVDGPWGRLIGPDRVLPSAPKGRRPDRTYWFLADGDSPRALYFETDHGGRNFEYCRVTPLPDGNEVCYGAAMFGPDVPNRFGLDQDAHLAKLEVNGSRGGFRDYPHFVATDVSLMNFDARTALAQAGEAFQRFVASEREATDAVLQDAACRAGGPLGRERTTEQEGIFPSWTSRDQRLRVLFVRHEQRTSTRTVIRHVPCHGNKTRILRGPSAPPEMPYIMPCPRDERVTVTRSYAVEIAAAYEFDAGGRLIAITEYLPAPLPAQRDDVGKEYVRSGW